MFSNRIDPDRVMLIGNPLSVVLMEAFHVKMDQIVGPSWLTSDWLRQDEALGNRHERGAIEGWSSSVWVSGAVR